MDWRTRTMVKGLAALVCVLGLAGCNAPQQSPQQRAQELAQRAQSFQAEVAKAGKISPDQQQAFDKLVADVEAYNTATKRTDVTVEQGSISTGGGPAFSARQTGSGGATCELNCPSIPENAPPGYICTPDGESFCDPRTGNQVCSYKCVKVVLVLPRTGP